MLFLFEGNFARIPFFEAAVFVESAYATIVKIDSGVPRQPDGGERKCETEKIPPDKIGKDELRAKPHDEKERKDCHHPKAIRKRLTVIAYHPGEKVEFSHALIIARQEIFVNESVNKNQPRRGGAECAQIPQRSAPYDVLSRSELSCRNCRSRRSS